MFSFFVSHAHELLIKLQEQLYLVSVSIFIASLIGIPLGALAAHRKRLGFLVIAAVNMLQTIPGLALLVLLLPLLGLGMPSAITALAIYALLPITINTLTGIRNITPANQEAAYGLGLTAWQRLTLIELPLATPAIIAGIRTATTICVGTATLAAFVGAGGLGDFINRGLALNDTRLLLLGAIPATLLALSLDMLIHTLQSVVKRYPLKSILLTAVIIFAAASIGFLFTLRCGYFTPCNKIRIGAANFTEQFILGELMAQLVEAKTSLQVERKFNLGTTDLLRNALRNNEIDLFADYTGSGYLIALHQSYTGMPRKKLYDFVKHAYLEKFNFVLLLPFGFNDTQAITVSDTFAKQHQLKTISDLIPFNRQLTIAAPAEFSQRPDGMKGLLKHYGLVFKSMKEMEPTLVYEAIKNNLADVILAFSTDGRILAHHLTVLRDDRSLFPAYDAAPVMQKSFLDAHPELKTVLQQLANQLNDNTMAGLNAEVDLHKKNPEDVARRFLEQQKLLPVK